MYRLLRQRPSLSLSIHLSSRASRLPQSTVTALTSNTRVYQQYQTIQTQAHPVYNILPRRFLSTHKDATALLDATGTGDIQQLTELLANGHNGMCIRNIHNI